MTIGVIIAVCIILLVLAFLVPRLTGPQKGVDRTLGVGQRSGRQGPGSAREAVLQVLRDVAQGDQQECQHRS